MRGPAASSARSRSRLATAVLLVVALGGCSRQPTEPASFYQPFTGSAPLAIRGIRPGMDETEVVALLGAPDRQSGSEYQPLSLQWQRLPDLVVSVDRRTRRVSDVLGSQVDAAGEAVVSHGMSGADVRAILGEPSRSQGRYRPSGSGVISVGVKKAGETLSYRRDGNDVEITLNDDALAYVHLRPGPA